ncbi:nucleotidyl transferase AbiEii/AbiGii toxin family protein [Niallia sp. FSL W8-0177]|uniref:nucleotidyl transferase AbiEii/AbiGii toxin family protein n=1 Tax=Niallia sp. FSL W8-0177 TaxID=2954522 RepID=UPI0030FCEE08
MTTGLLASDYRLLAVQAIFSDDKLMEIVTLKGGNAMQLLELTNRASQDLDLSIKQGIKMSEEIEGPLFQKSLSRIFQENELVVIDYKFTSKPKKSKSILPPFWGGYHIEFKIIQEEIYEAFKDNPQKLSNMAETMEDNKKKIEIDISLEEYTEPRIELEIGEYTIYLYSPLMIVYEKIRALCQQLPDYILASKEKTRARDLYDIYTAIMKLKSDFREEILNEKNLYILKEMFYTKKVPFNLLLKIRDYKEELQKDYEERVIPQIPEDDTYPEFEFLFEYNLELIEQLHKLIA